MSAVGQGIEGIPALTSEGATAFQFKSTGSVASGGLTIANRNGHRRTLIDIFFQAETSGLFLNIQVGDRTYIRLPTKLGDFTFSTTANQGVAFLRQQNAVKRGKGTLWGLHDIIPFDFPTAAQDESIIITVVGTALNGISYGTIPGTYVISALYLDQTDGDVASKTVPGGSYSQRRLFMNDMTNSLSQRTSGQTLLDTSLTPSGLNGIADNQKMTAGLKFTAYAYMYDASALGTTTGGNANGRPTRLHITDVDQELFTVEDQEGLLLDRNLNNILAFDWALESWFSPVQPYVFHQNRNFRFQLDTGQLAGAGANFAASSQYFGMIGIREPEA